MTCVGAGIGKPLGAVNDNGAKIIDVGARWPRLNEIADPGKETGGVVVRKKMGRIEAKGTGPFQRGFVDSGAGRVGCRARAAIGAVGVAAGEELGYDDPIARGHSFEFRINGEDAGRNFMPAPGTVTKMRVPQGPGVRWDAGIEEGDTVAGAFDSMIAKLIVTGSTRQQALERSRRALDELVVDGMPTVVPFHQAIVRDPAFAPADPDAPFTVHTRWIETEFDNQIAPYGGEVGEAAEDDGERQKITVEVGGKRLEVVLPGGLSLGGGGGAASTVFAGVVLLAADES